MVECNAKNILIIDDDEMMAECFSQTLNTGQTLSADHLKASQPRSDQSYQVQLCPNAIVAMELLNSKLPDLIILDILLDGPDGFSFLNELISYDDTAKIPVIIVSSLDLSHQDLSHYGVAAVLQKETITPAQLLATVQGVLADV